MPSVELDDRFVRVPSVDLKAFCFTVGRPLPDTVIECEGLLVPLAREQSSLALASALVLPSALALVLPRALPVQTAQALSPFARRLGPPSFSPYSHLM